MKIVQKLITVQHRYGVYKNIIQNVIFNLRTDNMSVIALID